MNWINELYLTLSHCAEYYGFLGTKVPGDEVDTNPIAQGRCTFVFHSAVADLCLQDWGFNMLEECHVSSEKESV